SPSRIRLMLLPTRLSSRMYPAWMSSTVAMVARISAVSSAARDVPKPHVSRTGPGRPAAARAVILGPMTDPAGPADLVFTGGHVHTVDPELPRADAVAVRGERIVAVGSAADVAGLIGRGTRVVDLDGRLLLPGFQDAHIHPISGGVDRLQCDVRDARGRDGVRDAIREYAAAHPDDDWVIGSGWYMADFENGTPRREDLDAIIPDRPALFPNRDGHSTWVNTKALELAGIDRDTPDPTDGRIERDPDGTPTGTLHEGAGHLVERLMPEVTAATLTDGLRLAQAYLHSLGITGWQDAIVRPEDQ